MENIEKAVMACTLEQDLGSEVPAGTVLHLDENTYNALVGSGICREATPDEVNGTGEEKEEVADPDAPTDEQPKPPVAENSLETAQRNIENIIVKSAEKVAEKMRTNAEIKRPNFFSEARDKDNEKKGGFKSIGDMLHCIHARATGDYSALKKLDKAKIMNNEYVRRTKGVMTISGGSGHEGGDLIPQYWAENIWSLSFQDVPDLFHMSNKENMGGGQTLNLPIWSQTSGTSGVQSQVTAEASIINDSKGVTANHQLVLKKRTILVNTSDELERFTPYALESLLRRVFPERLGYAVNDDYINGGNNMANLIGHASTVVVPRSQASHMNYDDVTAMSSHLFGGMNGAVWLAANGSIPEIYGMPYPNRTATTQFPAFSPGTFTQENLLGAEADGKLLGKPLFFLENVPALGTKGDLILYKPAQIASGEAGGELDKTPFLYFNYAEFTYRFLCYMASVPYMDQPYTRKNGDEASYCVVLGDHSS